MKVQFSIYNFLLSYVHVCVGTCIHETICKFVGKTEQKMIEKLAWLWLGCEFWTPPLCCQSQWTELSKVYIQSYAVTSFQNLIHQPATPKEVHCIFTAWGLQLRILLLWRIELWRSCTWWMSKIQGTWKNGRYNIKNDTGSYQCPKSQGLWITWRKGWLT